MTARAWPSANYSRDENLLPTSVKKQLISGYVRVLVKIVRFGIAFQPVGVYIYRGSKDMLNHSYMDPWVCRRLWCDFGRYE